MQAVTLTKLNRTFVEKVWGIDRLPAPFPHPISGRIGEVWYEPAAPLSDLLVKRLFTSERLSVQVHPSDDQARALGLGQTGKEEAWIIRSAEPGAMIALGFRRAVSPEDMRAAALDGSIMELLAWHEVKAGDVFHIPPGTVHAIGNGIDLLEVQQNCDITLRLFDYGRPRELHLDQAIEVAEGAIYSAARRSTIDTAGGVLVDGPYFRIRHCPGGDASLIENRSASPALIIPWRGDCVAFGTSLNDGDCYCGTILASDIAGAACDVLIVEPVV